MRVENNNNNKSKKKTKNHNNQKTPAFNALSLFQRVYARSLVSCSPALLLTFTPAPASSTNNTRLKSASCVCVCVCVHVCVCICVFYNQLSNILTFSFVVLHSSKHFSALSQRALFNMLS